MSLAERIDTAIDAALVNRIVGCVVLVRQNGQEIYAHAAGFADREAKLAMRRDAIFRLAFVTKPIVATATLRMCELGLLSLEDQVTKYFPWFTPRMGDGNAPTILIRHLLTHTSGITYDVTSDVAAGMSGPIISLEENLRRITKMPLKFMPGQGWAYGMSIDVLGGVIAAINGSSLEAVLAKYVCEPLGMVDTHFHVTNTRRLAIPYADGNPPKRMGEPEILQDDFGSVKFSPERIFNRDAPQSGGAGMAGTADDVMKVLDGYVAAHPLLKPETIAHALANQIGKISRGPQDTGKGFSFIGAVTTDRKLAQTPCPNGTVDWGGSWGLNWFIDPINRFTVLTCTNTAFEGCMGPFREDIRDAVYG
jgi:CubicO group peptidase (beta-lactamase class C family)